MAIQMRRGLKANLDTSRLVAGEMVVATDANEDYVAVAKAPSDVIQLATKDELDGKVDAVSGKGLSTNDYTNADKTIVGGVTSALASKVDKVTGKGLSTNDYTDSDKTKVGNAVTKSSTSGLLKNDGTVDTSTYLKTIPTASTSTLGGVKIDGSSITISNGVISAHGSGGASDLDDLSDVNITSPSNGQILKYNLSAEEWVNSNVDSTPTQNSTNPVSSGGTYTALADKPSKANVIANTQLIADTVGFSGKNVLPINVASGTSNGITWVVNSDKSVTVYGTATARVDIALIPTKAEILKDFLPYVGETLIITGCPSGGTVATGYWVSAQGLETDGIGANDVGNGASFTVHDFTNYQTVGIRISIANGVNMGTQANPKVFKPMIRLADILDSTYEPYRGTTAFPRDEQAVLGAKNRVPFPYHEGMSKSANGVTFTVDENGVIDVDTNGQASTATTSFAVMTTKARYNDGYLLSGKSQYANTDVKLQYYDETAGYGFDATEDGVLIQNSNGHNCRLVILVPSGKTISHAKFYPMLRLATDTDNTYVPYAMTNRELTEAIGSGGGSTVVPNPQGTATIDLTKIGIDGTNYNIPTSDNTWVDITNDITFTYQFNDTNSKFYRNGKMVVFTIWGTYTSYDPDAANYIINSSSAINPIYRFVSPIQLHDTDTVLGSNLQFGLVTASSVGNRGSIYVSGTNSSGEVDVYGSGFFVEA